MKLKAYLRETGITYEKFGATIGKTASAISRYANDKRKPDLETAVAIEIASDGRVLPRDFLNTRKAAGDRRAA